MADRNDARNVVLHDVLNVRVVLLLSPARPARLAVLRLALRLPVHVLSVLAHVPVGSEVHVLAV